MQTKYVKVPIYPLVRYLLPDERQAIPSAKAPTVFEYDGASITVDAVVRCEQGVSRKVGGRGYMFVCRVSWLPKGVLRSKESVVWYDDFYDEWFLEVPENCAPREQVSTLMPEISMPSGKHNSQPASILFADLFVQERIYPLVRYLKPQEKKGIPSNKIPFAFEYDDATMVIQRMMACEEKDARKLKRGTEEGYRFVCLIANQQAPERQVRQYTLWHYIEQDAWYFEVPQAMVRNDYDEGPQIV